MVCHIITIDDAIQRTFELGPTTTDKDWYYKCLFWFIQQTNIYLATTE